jgi:RimJ/RimL family protein N-acetyltransferase
MAPLMPMVLAGRHLRLEPLAPGHAADLAAAGAGDRSSFSHTWVPDGLADAERYIERALADAERGTALQFVQRRLSDGVVVGSTRYLNIEHWVWAEGNGAPDVAEIGSTWLSSSAQRSAINTEAKLLLMTQAFEVWAVQRLWIKTDAVNVRSRAAIERLGASFEGILRHQAPAVGRPGPRDTASYSVIPGQWPAVRAGLESRLADS